MEDLQRLKGQVAREGNTDVKMMEEFRLLLWTQGTMITVGTLNNVLMTVLQEELALRRGWYGASGLLVSSIRELCCHWVFMKLIHRNQIGGNKEQGRGTDWDNRGEAGHQSPRSEIAYH